MHIKAFEEKLDQIGKDSIPITELAAALSTEAWAGKFGEGSALNELLLSLPNSGNGSVDNTSLRSLGLLWCDGSVKDKTSALCSIINPPGQSQDQGITASDKEFLSLLSAHFLIATWWTEQTVDRVNPGSSMKRFYTDEEKTKRVVKAFIN